MNHTLSAEALARAAARRGWLDQQDLARITETMRGVERDGLVEALRAAGATTVADHLGDLLPPPGHPGFGRWRALARLGGGTMGTVWLTATLSGRAPLLGGEAGGSVWTAGSVESERASADGELIERFAREARITAGLQHPRIVPCLDGGIAGDGTRYLVLSWVPTGDLAAELARGGPLRPAAALAVADQLADALDHAHACGVIHRDLKPANIFVHADGSILLGDFGLARPTSAGATRLTMAGVAVGTPNAMAPEQIDGRDAIDGRADLYALGCLLFTCLAGRAPFCGRSAEVMHAHRTIQPPHLDSLVPGLPPGLAELVARLLAKRPEDRPDSATAVRRALAPILLACAIQSGVPIPLREHVAPCPQAMADDALLLHGPEGDPSLVVWNRRRIVLGKQRTAGVDLVMRDYPEEMHRERLSRVSRKHVAISLADDGSAIIEDLGSANGTTIDDVILAAGTSRTVTGMVELALAGVARLTVLVLPGSIVLFRPGNRPGLAYAMVPERLRLGAAGDVPIADATATVELARSPEGWTCDGDPLSDVLDLGGVRLQVQPLGDFL